MNDKQKEFYAAIEARDAYWDALRDLEGQMECEVEGSDIDSLDATESDFALFLEECESKRQESATEVQS